MMYIIHNVYIIPYNTDDGRARLDRINQLLHITSCVGIAISHEKRENGKFVDEKFLTGKSDEKNGKLSSLK